MIQIEVIIDHDHVTETAIMQDQIHGTEVEKIDFVSDAVKRVIILKIAELLTGQYLNTEGGLTDIIHVIAIAAIQEIEIRA